MDAPASLTSGGTRDARLWLSLMLVPVLVVGAGTVVMLLARSATTESTEQLARKQLATQADSVERDISLALDQADPMLERLRAIADPALLIDDVAPRLVALVAGRPGVANVSIGFSSGRMRGTYVADASSEIRVQESIVGDAGTQRTNYAVSGGELRTLETKTTDYDVRKRDHYKLAVEAATRAWTPPRVYFSSKSTGVTAVEPIFTDGQLSAVVTVDFDVGALSQFLGRPTVAGAHSVLFTGDGTVLAFPAVAVPEAAIKEGRLLRAADYADPTLTAVLQAVAGKAIDKQTFLRIDTPSGAQLASIAPVGGQRAGVATPLVWYLAAYVPEETLLAPTHSMQIKSVIAFAAALLLALGVALVLAWNILRMRREVSTAKAQARSAEARIARLGAYKLIARLGKGGMGEVWRAEHGLIARSAAVKLVRPEALVDPDQRRRSIERFRREAQTLAQMKSRHTIALYDYGITDDTFYYVMELLDGVDLDVLVRDTGAQPAARVIRILIQACQSLAEAHDAGLLHRDIKPANLVLCRAADEVDIVKLLDFGIVQSIDAPIGPAIDLASLPVETELSPDSKLTRDGAIVGTPGYIPPEQAVGARVDARSDLYSLGCVAWWLLARGEIYPRPDDMTSIKSHVMDDLPDLRSRVDGWLPEDLENLVYALLAKHPDDRPADARAVIGWLRAIPISPEHDWTEDQAHMWWATMRPVEVTSQPTDERVFIAENATRTEYTRGGDTHAGGTHDDQGDSGEMIYTRS
ncbi:MAG TPA: protein kinase [Kofleriaceae bacterium]